jgi:hypothetical protein
MEFDLGRYQDALNDIDTAIRTNYDSAENVFNDGNVKPNQPVASLCSFAMKDWNALVERFPKDYRPSLYVALYLI